MTDAGSPGDRGAAAVRDREKPRLRAESLGLTLARITAARQALADAEGLAAVSMAQVAESLGVTTMALYRYLAGKDELLALMSDAEHPWLIQALGAIPRPCAAPPVDGPPGGGDRGALAAGAQRGQGDRGCRSHGTPRDAGRCAERWRSSGRAAGPPPLLDYDILLRRLTDPDEHPEIAAALAPGAFGRPDDGGGADQPYDVRFGLALFLDGVQALIDRVSVGAASVPPGTTEDVR